MTTLDTAPEQAPEAADPEEVAGRVVGILNDGAICVLASIGHELGLFDTLSELPPATSTWRRFEAPWKAALASARSGPETTATRARLSSRT